MEKILTAKELFDKMISENDETTSTEMMIEFAKMHVEAALKEASENGLVDAGEGGYTGFVDKDSILSSYPLSNIK